ncbi:phage tail protein [Escherichia coli]|nr:phage tail protein [Escherichia coli]EGI4004336.1 phage tail protein [Escherichia coli]EGI4009497.1 phage tail protein [Escherichia coli]EGI4024030.1 phage tail protein [Escherichia coli]EGJ6501139.1 phage tail protein [Escherichia coli]
MNRREAEDAELAGGVRFDPDGNEVIPVSPDMADMTEDDAMLMTISEGIAGGVRYG